MLDNVSSSVWLEVESLEATKKQLFCGGVFRCFVEVRVSALGVGRRGACSFYLPWRFTDLHTIFRTAFQLDSSCLDMHTRSTDAF